ncbi:retropepsin-like aspartic protease family protein [Hoeflea olei]|uniref:Aspartyl protease n=1 Tax=Hoeflea olei TaxID=1480615 RepID=A0A1C1YX27_9HYPH|nr:TIGR02281 family clan AA aspartic protease [Hoeflea olei]OCW58061.1 hypothetical protein AWJ14_01475 [Hoeflea olei]
MLKNLFLVCCSVLAVSSLPYYAQDISTYLSREAAPKTASPSPVTSHAQPAEAAKPVAHYATGVRAASIPMNRDGHFSADFHINGRYVRGLIDTGATYVAINRSVAQSLGVSPANSEYKHTVRTANGSTRAALVSLDRMEVGSITVRDVQAFVLDDSALSTALIGMSFMSKLQSYRVDNNKLELVN